jgi:peptidyl-prolyl cis-trans isomerase D
MLSFFRRALSSWAVLGLLGLVMVAFIVTGVGPSDGGFGTNSLGGSGDTVATIGGQKLHASEIARRAESELRAVRQQSPQNQGLDMASFVSGGGLDQTVAQTIGARAMEVWAREHGMTASDKLIDGEIGSIAAFAGPTGKFDRAAFDAILQRERISERDLRADIAGDLIRRQLLVPITGATRAPVSLITPYASLLLEARRGLIGVVPTQAMTGGAAPSDAEINAFYARNLARYTIPERRVIRYALFGREQLKAPVTPTEAEIAAFYKSNAPTYAAKQTRTFSQVILDSEAKARALATAVRGGTAFAAAAAAQGFGAADIALGEKSQADLTKLASAAVATAAFAAPQGGITDPVRSPLGWHVLRVDAIKAVPGRTLDQVRGEIAASLDKQKADEALAAMVAAIEDDIAGGSSFDDVVKSNNLAVVTTPPVLASGQSPDQPGYQAPPELGVLLKNAFAAAPDEDPTVETIGNGQRFAVLGVARIVPAAPAPLQQIRAQVAADVAADRGFQRAKTIADGIVAKAKAGVPLPKAFADTGLKLPPPEPAGGRQIDLARGQTPPPPPLALMFNMRQGDTKVLAAPDRQGWFVIHLDTIERGDARGTPGLIDATRGQFVEVLGREYAEQFSAAVQKELGVKRDDAAIARLKASLSSGGATAQ